MSARVTEDLAFTYAQSAFPPVGSALEARREMASLSSDSPSRGPAGWPMVNAERQTTTVKMRTNMVPCRKIEVGTYNSPPPWRFRRPSFDAISCVPQCRENVPRHRSDRSRPVRTVGALQFQL